MFETSIEVFWTHTLHPATNLTKLENVTFATYYCKRRNHYHHQGVGGESLLIPFKKEKNRRNHYSLHEIETCLHLFRWFFLTLFLSIVATFEQRSLRRSVKSIEVCEFTCFEQAEWHGKVSTAKIKYFGVHLSGHLKLPLRRRNWRGILLIAKMQLLLGHGGETDACLQSTNVHSTVTFIPMPCCSGGWGGCC